MTVRDWVKFLENDERTERVGLQMEGGLPCKNASHVYKEEIENTFYKWYLNEEVVDVKYENYPGATLLIYRAK